MPRLIHCKIDVKKLDKSKLYKGEKGTYANITLIETPGGKYGDWMVVEDKAKDAPREEKSTILGNGKNKNWGSDSGRSDAGTTSGPSAPSSGPSSGDLPF